MVLSQRDLPLDLVVVLTTSLCPDVDAWLACEPLCPVSALSRASAPSCSLKATLGEGSATSGVDGTPNGWESASGLLVVTLMASAESEASSALSPIG